MEVDTRQLIALASALVHADECLHNGNVRVQALRTHGPSQDLTAMETMLVVAKPLMSDLQKQGFLPVRRDGINYLVQEKEDD